MLELVALDAARESLDWLKVLEKRVKELEERVFELEQQVEVLSDVDETIRSIVVQLRARGFRL